MTGHMWEQHSFWGCCFATWMKISDHGGWGKEFAPAAVKPGIKGCRSLKLNTPYPIIHQKRCIACFTAQKFRVGVWREGENVILGSTLVSLFCFFCMLFHTLFTNLVWQITSSALLLHKGIHSHKGFPVSKMVMIMPDACMGGDREGLGITGVWCSSLHFSIAPHIYELKASVCPVIVGE